MIETLRDHPNFFATGEEQRGFTECRSTTDNIVLLQNRVNHANEFGLKKFWVFVDFFRAYDNMRTDELISTYMERAADWTSESGKKRVSSMVAMCKHMSLVVGDYLIA